MEKFESYDSDTLDRICFTDVFICEVFCGSSHLCRYHSLPLPTLFHTTYWPSSPWTRAITSRVNVLLDNLIDVQIRHMHILEMNHDNHDFQRQAKWQQWSFIRVSYPCDLPPSSFTRSTSDRSTLQSRCKKQTSGHLEVLTHPRRLTADGCWKFR